MTLLGQWCYFLGTATRADFSTAMWLAPQTAAGCTPSSASASIMFNSMIINSVALPQYTDVVSEQPSLASDCASSVTADHVQFNDYRYCGSTAGVRRCCQQWAAESLQVLPSATGTAALFGHGATACCFGRGTVTDFSTAMWSATQTVACCAPSSATDQLSHCRCVSFTECRRPALLQLFGHHWCYRAVPLICWVTAGVYVLRNVRGSFFADVVLRNSRGSSYYADVAFVEFPRIHFWSRG